MGLVLAASAVRAGTVVIRGADNAGRPVANDHRLRVAAARRARMRRKLVESARFVFVRCE
jgi:hypothetical protein